MNNDIVGGLQGMGAMVGECAGGMELENVLGVDIFKPVASSPDEVALINNCGPKKRMIEGANSEETALVMGRDVEVSITLGDSIRAFCSRLEFDGARMFGSERLVGVEHMQLVSARDKGAGVNLGTEGIRVMVNRWCIGFRRSGGISEMTSTDGDHRGGGT